MFQVVVGTTPSGIVADSCKRQQLILAPFDETVYELKVYVTQFRAFLVRNSLKRGFKLRGGATPVTLYLDGVKLGKVFPLDGF